MAEESTPIRVLIQHDFIDIAPKYLDTVRRSLGEIREAMALSDMDTVRSMGHQMKGEGAPFGFELISQLGIKLQQAAESKDVESIATILDRLGHYLDSIVLESA
ncbi:MAG: Hpt domain-containing protein [Proteobacteria bacterium]|nr:Hpt domain-containing protein [Pseudomonadota bacterium]